MLHTLAIGLRFFWILMFQPVFECENFEIQYFPKCLMLLVFTSLSLR